MGLAALLLLASEPVAAATRTWTGLGLTNNWNDAGNWLGGLIPGAADVATFDATGSKNATINAAINVAGISVTSGYGGTITQAPGIAATVGATGFNQAGATFVGGTSAITMNGPLTLSGGSFTSTAGTLTVTGATTVTGGSFTANGGSTTFSGGAATIDTAGLVTLNNATFAATKTIAAGTTLTVGGTLSLTGGSLNGAGTVAARGAINQALGYGGGTATLLINGAGAQTLTGASTTASGNLPLVVINKPSGTLTLAGTLRTSNNWTYTGGTLDPGTSTLVFAGGTITGSHALNAVDFRATTSIAAGTTLTVTGALSLTSGALNGTGTVAAQGAISQASTTTGGTATLLINGAGAQTFTGAATTAAGALPPLVINKPSGTLTLAGTLRTATNWTYTAGTVDPGSVHGRLRGRHDHGVAQPQRGRLPGSDHDRRRDDAHGARHGQPRHEHPQHRHPGGGQGDINQALGYGGGTATLLINGAGAQTLTGASTTASGNLPLVVINKPSGTLTLAGTLRTSNNWTYTGGTLDPGTSTLVFAGGTITGSHALNAVDFRATTSIAAGTTLTVSGRAQPDQRGAQRDGYRGRPGRHQPGLDHDRRDGHPAHQRGRRADVHGRRHDGRRGAAPAGHQQALGHAHPGRHPAHRHQLDVHRGDGRPGHVHGRLRGRHDHGVAQPQRGRLPGSDHDRRRDDAHGARHGQPRHEHPQHRHPGGGRVTSTRPSAMAAGRPPC